ncbi:hypothetical protein GCM10010303_78420 [Streptomyces purpurascens]|nr:hypothetical protein GCM10010303_78420 [Streptomyces purpurascens]
MGGPVVGTRQIRVRGAVLGGDVDSGSLYGGHGWAASLRGVGPAGPGQEPARVTGRITGIVTRRFPGHFAHPPHTVEP